MIPGPSPIRFFAQQARRPKGRIGKFMMTRFFDRVNARLLDHMVELLDVAPGDAALDVGCAGGSVVERLAGATRSGRAVGLDFSPDMVEHARHRLRPLIEGRQAEIVEGDAAAMPFDNAEFQKICTANTIYFWPAPANVIAELARVLAPGGTLVVAYRTREQLAGSPFSKHGFTLYGTEEVEGLLCGAGLADVRTETRSVRRGLDTYCTVGRGAGLE